MVKEEHEKNSIQYEISLNSFKQQVAQKQSALEKLSYEISVKISNNQHKKKEGTCQMVQLCRKNIEQIEHIFMDLHSYFVDLNLQFIYDISVEIFKTLVLGFKLLSERFVTLLKNRKKKDDSQSDQNFQRTTEKMIQETRNKNFTEMQYYDCLIKNIQLDEYRLSEKKKQAQRKILIDRTIVQSVNASDAVNQLQNLKRQMDRIIIHSVKFANDSTTIQQNESKMGLKSLTRPEEIQNEYCTKIAENTQQIFINKMNEIVKKYHQTIKQKQREEIMKQIEKNKPLQIHAQIQTFDFEAKHKLQPNKSSLIVDNEGLKKANNGLKKQLYELSKQMERKEQEHKQLQAKIKHTLDLLNKKNLQLHKAKCQFQFNLGKKDQAIQSLNKKIVQIQDINEKINKEVKKSKQSSNLSPESNLETFSYNDQSLIDMKNQDDELSLKLKLTGNKTHHTSFFYERQFKATKQQNNHLRKSLSIMLDALKQQKLILQYPINDLNNDLRLGRLISKIEAISIELLNKVKEIRLRDQTKYDQGPARSNKKKTFIRTQSNIIESDRKRNSERKFVVAETQTEENYYIQSIYHPQRAQSHRKTDRMEMEKKDNDKLEMLKKQLLNKVNLGKRSHATVGIMSRQKENKKEINSRKYSSNVSYQNLPCAEQQKRASKTKQLFNRKDVSFEQFKFSILENKSQYAEKKMLTRSKKIINPNLKNSMNKEKRRANNKSHEIRQINEDHQDRQDEQILESQTCECQKDVKKIVNMIESKQNKSDGYLKYFINKLVTELTKVKGDQTTDELTSSQNSYYVKQNHTHTLSCL